jgi:FMN phosphatase YigB (HAD superfamily)
VVWDIDGTLAEYHDHLGSMACEYWNQDWPDGHWDGSGEFEDWLGLTKAQYRQAKMAFRQGGYKRTMPVYADILPIYFTTRRWRSLAQAELWIATHRPWMRLDNIDPDTQWWLQSREFDYDHLLFSEDKYADLVKQVDHERVIAVFDDLPEMVDRAIDLGLPARQVARPHNQAAGQKHPTQGTVGELSRWLSEQMIKWNSE